MPKQKDRLAGNPAAGLSAVTAKETVERQLAHLKN